MNIRFGDSIDLIKRIYGIADFTDSLYENTTLQLFEIKDTA